MAYTSHIKHQQGVVKDSPKSIIYLSAAHRGLFISSLESFELVNTRIGLRHSNS